MNFIQEVKRIIDNTNGSMFVVDFIKVDGTPRKMYCKKGITRPSKRGASKPKKRTYTMTKKREELINVWDCESKAYRSIKPNKILRISSRFEILEHPMGIIKVDGVVFVGEVEDFEIKFGE